MKYNLILTFTLAATLLILDSMDAFHAVAMFIVGGVVPGTAIVLSAGDMMMIVALIGGFTLSRLTMVAFAKLPSSRIFIKST